MHAWRDIVWHRLRASLWFIPVLVVTAALALAVLALALDDLITEGVVWHTLPIRPMGPDGARALLSTVAGAMVTVASLVFSITLLVLTMASGQLGPRLLRLFMTDRMIQVVLGAFLATFVYCLVVLRTVGGQDDAQHVPELSVVLAMLLAIACFCLLIAFIHHMARQIQADTVIAETAADLERSIKTIFPEHPPDRADRSAEGAPPSQTGAAVPAGIAGYVEAIDTDALVKLGAEHDLVVTMLLRPGQFVLDGLPLALVHPKERASATVIGEVCEAIVVSDQRTPTQDVEYAFGALVEIAARALSPGINDPSTAIACLDSLSAALGHVMRRGPAPRLHKDEDGRARLFLKPPGIAGLADRAFNEIRQFGANQPTILIRMLELLTMLAEVAQTREADEAVADHARRAIRAARTGIEDPGDLADAEERIAALLRALPGVDIEKGKSVDSPSP